MISLQGLLFERENSTNLEDYWKKEVLTNKDSKTFKTPERVSPFVKKTRPTSIEFEWPPINSASTYVLKMVGRAGKLIAGESVQVRLGRNTFLNLWKIKKKY